MLVLGRQRRAANSCGMQDKVSFRARLREQRRAELLRGTQQEVLLQEARFNSLVATRFETFRDTY